MIALADTLRPGDRITAHAWGEGPTVVILREPITEADRFGRPLRRYWARREDTAEEGFVSYGDGGVANVISRASAT